MQKPRQRSIKLYKQKDEFMNKNLVSVFHLLSIYHHQSQLIGSSSIRNFLYVNDYDLNENFKVKYSNEILDKLYIEFRNVFLKAKKSDDIFILDFKCGQDVNNEPLRWKYPDIMKGFQISHKTKYKFVDCLLQNSTIKIDICYVLDNIFQDITNNYFIEFTHQKEILGGAVKSEIQNLTEEMRELIKDGNYIKALKRLFSIQKISKDIDQKLLDLLNSFIGRLYKGINQLNLIIQMLEQTFKPLDIKLAHINIENVKQFASNITEINIDNLLLDLNKLSKTNNKKILIKKLKLIVSQLDDDLNAYIKAHYKHIFDL
jgi:hypothetical protein